MNIVKHMEAAFFVVLSVAGAASVAVDAIPEAQARVAPAAVQVQATRVAAAVPMAVVHVSAKRMTAAEKQASLARERAGQPI